MSACALNSSLRCLLFIPKKNIIAYAKDKKEAKLHVVYKKVLNIECTKEKIIKITELGLKYAPKLLLGCHHWK